MFFFQKNQPQRKLILADNSTINETQEYGYKCIFSFNLNMQLLLLGQNVCEVNRERSCLVATSSVCDSTKHNGLVTTQSKLVSSHLFLKLCHQLFPLDPELFQSIQLFGQHHILGSKGFFGFGKLLQPRNSLFKHLGMLLLKILNIYLFM